MFDFLNIELRTLIAFFIILHKLKAVHAKLFNPMSLILILLKHKMRAM